MEGNYLTSGDLAMWDTARTSRAGNFYGAYEGGYGCYHHGGRGMAATGIGLAAGLGGGALLLAAAGIWGVNQASKARSRGAETTAAAQAKTMELIAATVNREATRQDAINIDVAQTQRTLTGATAQGGSAGAFASSLANAEAVAQLLNNNGLNSAVGSYNFLRVQPVSVQNCGCGCGNA